ncbi:MAG: DUF3164 family protein [Paludibacteraceae bacterium]|nr:DUF3164 family protein [Paludibacteraceae bacterium]
MAEEAKQTVEMTAQEAAEFAAFKQAQQKKAEEERKKKEREQYAQLVDETIATSIDKLTAVSNKLKETKKSVYDDFQAVLQMKADMMKIKDDQRSHTFTNSDSTMRITLGCNMVDGYRDTANEGIAMVKEYISSLAKDAESKQLVDAVLRLLAHDQRGELKAQNILKLRRMADESNSDEFREGVRIIEEAYQPTQTKTYIRAEMKNDKGAWITLPLGITEA